MNLMFLFIPSILFLSVQAKERDLTPGIQCKKEGNHCADCKTLVYCKQSDYGYDTEVVSFCGENSQCVETDEIKPHCQRNGICRYKPFSCWNLPDGVYPDPYSCEEFHECFNQNQYDMVCPFPLVYDANAGTCNKTKDCRTLNPCKTKEEVIILPETRFEYKCTEETQPYKIMYPKFLSNEAWLPEDCPNPGKFPDPADCRGYFVCTKDGNKFKIERKSCASDQHFVDDCVLGAC